MFALPKWLTDIRQAVAGTSGAPGGANPFVTNSDARLSPLRNALTTVTIGNSISAQSQFGYGSISAWGMISELQLANALSGGALLFKRMTASTRADTWGVYGYSGQTLPTIQSDLAAQLFTPLQTAGIVPDLVVGLALVENDLVTGPTSVANMQASLTTFIRDIQARYPGAILLLCTPRPSFSYNTPTIVTNYQAIRDYMLSLDNGINVFVSRLDTYENPSSPGTPLAGFTDVSVHPNAKGALRNARVIAATLRRISHTWKVPYYTLSTNMALTGTGTATGTNVSGTVPTSCTIAGSANGTYVSTAEKPGFLQSVTANATGANPPVDLSTANMGALSLSGVTQISAFAEIEIVSGAENLSSVELAPRIQDGGGNTFHYYIQRQTPDADPEWVNGDILFLRQPPQIANSGSITAVTNYFRLWTKFAGGNVTFRVRSSGVGIVQ